MRCGFVAVVAGALLALPSTALAATIGFELTGRIGGRALPPGAYRLLAIPTTGTTPGVTATVGFRITASRP